MAIRLTTLGGLHIVRDEHELGWLPAQRVRTALLIYLAVERRVSRENVTALFWPESDDTNARQALRQSLYQLRKALGEEWVERRAHEIRVSERVRTDVEAVEEAVARGDPESTAKLYRGPFLDGVHLVDVSGWESWVDGRRTHYARVFRKACRDWLEMRRAAGDLAGAVEAAQCWVAPDPTDDEAQHRLIEALAAAGERAEAIRQYESYVRVLEPDGLRPLDETVELVGRLNRTTVALPAQKVPERPPDPVPAAPPEVRQPPRIRRRWRSAWVIAPPIAVVAVLYALSSNQPAVRVHAPVHVAVLDFHDETEARDVGWLASALTTGLTDALQRVTLLRVTPNSGVRAYRDAVTPQPEIARALGVHWLVSGKVRSSGNTIIARAELIDSMGRLIDSREIEGTRADALHLVEHTVDRVGDFLRDRIGREVLVRGWDAGTEDDGAFRLVHSAARDVEAADELGASGDLRAALRLLDRADSSLANAARRDSGWPEPHIQRAGLARKRAVVVLRSGFGGDSAAQALHTGIAHADVALQLRSARASALEMRGVLRHTLWLLAPPADSAAAAHLLHEAEADLTAASDADGTHARALNILSSIHYARGELGLARSTAERAYAADAYLEGAPEILDRLFTTTFEQGDDTRAKRWCDEIERRLAGHWLIASCRLKLMAWSDVQPTSPDEAWRLVQRTSDATSQGSASAVSAEIEMLMAAVLARAGAADSARSLLERTRNWIAKDSLLVNDQAGNFELLQVEAGVRVLLAQPEIATSLLEEYFSYRPTWRLTLASSRRFVGLQGEAPRAPQR